MNSMCLFMENIFTGTKYIQNVVENLEEAFQTKTKRGIGVSLAGASFSQDCIRKNEKIFKIFVEHFIREMVTKNN